MKPLARQAGCQPNKMGNALSQLDDDETKTKHTDDVVQVDILTRVLEDMTHTPKVALLNEPPRGKTNDVVSEQVRHKPTCTSKEKS